MIGSVRLSIEDTKQFHEGQGAKLQSFGRRNSLEKQCVSALDQREVRDKIITITNRRAGIEALIPMRIEAHGPKVIRC